MSFAGIMKMTMMMKLGGGGSDGGPGGTFLMPGRLVLGIACLALVLGQPVVAEKIPIGEFDFDVC